MARGREESKSVPDGEHAPEIRGQRITSYNGETVNKIPTIFIRDMSRQPALVTPEWHPDCLWVRDGEGVATHKWDGTSVLVRDGKLYKRRDFGLKW